jgi:hypothetical protein
MRSALNWQYAISLIFQRKLLFDVSRLLAAWWNLANWPQPEGVATKPEA